jgi:NAD(P)-dependent dehydrogenase (short-subunit alcohol dehydrogenase family)
MPLEGKLALVTGGSRGIGRGIALVLAGKGARVAIHYYKNEAAARETLQGVRKLGSDGFYLSGDITKMDQVEALVGRVKSEFGALDVPGGQRPAGSLRVLSSTASDYIGPMENGCRLAGHGVSGRCAIRRKYHA